MAYSTGNPPRLINQSVGGGFREWVYQSSQTVATVTGTTFITNGRDLGMQKNDFVKIVDTTTPIVKSALVLTTSTSGAVSLSTSVALTGST